jgi:hypothetical protein
LNSGKKRLSVTGGPDDGYSSVRIAPADQYQCIPSRARDDGAAFADQVGSFTLAGQQASEGFNSLVAEAFFRALLSAAF